MKIAIIGSGISGLTCAYLLSRSHEIHVFEANDYIGGHTHTVDVNVESGNYAIDTGFIVFNNWTYPNFIKLLQEIKIDSKPTSMGFSVKAEKSGLEYSGTNINTLFAQRSNLLRPSFHRMVQDILRFNREAIQLLEKNEASRQTLREYLAENHYSKEFSEHYIVPMGAAIWSASVRQMEDFPAEYFVRFFKNHGLLSINKRPEWRVVKGGSSSYIPNLTKAFSKNIHLKSEILSVERNKESVKIIGKKENQKFSLDFDQVIFASHSNETLKILGENATIEEKNILGSFTYQANETVLHTDASVLPKRKKAWAAWNYFIPSEKRNSVAVNYNMNILQGINAPETFSVSLNLQHQIDPNKILRKFTYHHPVYTNSSLAAQANWPRISSLSSRTHYCGAYWGFGFHEDGVKSALRVAEFFGERL